LAIIYLRLNTGSSPIYPKWAVGNVAESSQKVANVSVLLDTRYLCFNTLFADYMFSIGLQHTYFMDCSLGCYGLFWFISPASSNWPSIHWYRDWRISCCPFTIVPHARIYLYVQNNKKKLLFCSVFIFSFFLFYPFLPKWLWIILTTVY
jgi:hypothetical protein